MPPLLLLLALALVAPASHAQSPPAEGASEVDEAPPDAEGSAPDPALSYEDALEHAKLEYFQGEHEIARAALRALRARMEADDVGGSDTWEETLRYLGEVEYLLGDRAAAWRTFEAMLLARPEATMTTFNHPADVVHWFELVRQGLAQQQPPPPPPPLPPSPPPAWTYAPLGAPQFGLAQPRRGATYAVLQTAFGALSIGAFVHLTTINKADNPLGLSQDALAQRVAITRWAIQWPATLAFYGLWAGSHLDARRAWRARERVEVSVQVGNQRLGLALDGRF